MASISETSATENRPDAKAAENGPGTVSDALTAFETQAAKLPAEPAPDANAAVAFALGWAVGDALTCAKYQVFDHLAKVPTLDAPADQWNLLIHQIVSRCTDINNHLTSAKADRNLGAQLKTATDLLLDPPPSDIKTAVGAKSETAMELHTGILAVLWSVASPLAKSYQLGQEMEQMSATPLAEPSAAVSASVKDHNAELHRLLTALASRLPANAAHATDNSLRLWSASLEAGGEESAEDLLRQGRRWHDVLAGEVSGKDGLRLTDYVAAADSVAGKLRQTAGQVAARFKVWLIVAAVLVLVGFGLIIWGAKGTLGAGIATLLATFGLTWKGIGQFFGRAAARGEEELWDAEIDWAIAYRFTVLRHPPADHQLKPRSKALPAIDQPTKEHLLRYNQWKKNWPDVLTSGVGSGGGYRSEVGRYHARSAPPRGWLPRLLRVGAHRSDLLTKAPSNRLLARRVAAVGAACVAAAGTGVATVLSGAASSLSVGVSLGVLTAALVTLEGAVTVRDRRSRKQFRKETVDSWGQATDSSTGPEAHAGQHLSPANERSKAEASGDRNHDNGSDEGSRRGDSGCGDGGDSGNGGDGGSGGDGDVDSAPDGEPSRSDQRFFRAKLEDHPQEQPLRKDEQYTVAFSVGASSVDVIAQAEFPDDLLAEAYKDSEVLELTVQLDSDDFEILGESTRSLRVPRTGPSRGKARFDIAPRHNGQCQLVASVHYKGNFVHQMEVTIPVGGDRRAPVEVSTRGRPPDSAAAIEPRHICILLEPAPSSGYTCTRLGSDGGRTVLPITTTELAAAVERARSAMMDVIGWQAAGEKVFQTRIDIPRAAQDMALRTLARAGARLFQRLFLHPAAGMDARSVGEWLQGYAMDPGLRLKVQIFAYHAPLPWAMLYLGDASEDAELDWNYFLGMRHIVEQLPLQKSVGTRDNRIPSRPELAVSINVNPSIDDPAKGITLVAGHQKHWTEMAAARAGLTLVSRTTKREVVRALADRSTADQVVYFYCHATASEQNSHDPDTAEIIMGTNDRAMLADLNIDAPPSIQLPGNPLVFINACESAGLSPLFYDGFVPYFMDKGARGLIGTECKAPALFAVEWANAFFDRFLDGAAVGETVLALRQQFLREHGNPLGLIYAVHCDADTRVAPALAPAKAQDRGMTS